jgi:hypothetical protein
VRFWRQEIDDIEILIHGPLFFDLFDVYNSQLSSTPFDGVIRTGHILAKYIVLLDHRVHQSLASLVEHEDLPLQYGHKLDNPPPD